MAHDYWYVARINPVPWTAPSVSIGRKGGKPYPLVYSSTELKTFKSGLAEEIKDNYPDAPMIEDEIGLEFFFYRRLDSLDRGKSRRRARAHEADATNMQKSAEDALQGVLFKNDSQVISAHSWVMEQGEDVNPLVVIHLTWHPERPTLPDHVLSKIDDDPVLPGMGGNTIDIEIEEIF